MVPADGHLGYPPRLAPAGHTRIHAAVPDADVAGRADILRRRPWARHELHPRRGDHRDGHRRDRDRVDRAACPALVGRGGVAPSRSCSGASSPERSCSRWSTPRDCCWRWSPARSCGRAQTLAVGRDARRLRDGGRTGGDGDHPRARHGRTARDPPPRLARPRGAASVACADAGTGRVDRLRRVPVDLDRVPVCDYSAQQIELGMAGVELADRDPARGRQAVPPDHEFHLPRTRGSTSTCCPASLGTAFLLFAL